MIFNQLAQSGSSDASNIVSGTFTTGDATGVESVSIPYEGGGYPVTLFVEKVGGAFDDGGGFTLKVVPWFFASRKQWDDEESNAYTQGWLPSSASAATVSKVANASTFGGTPETGTAKCVAMPDATTLSYCVGTSQTLQLSTEYRYTIVYME